jgi:signal transduction histidine kinase
MTIETAISDANGFAIVAVTDAGTGISPEDQSKLFTPFFTTKRDGLGLGLSICQSIVHALGGHIKVESRSDRGAVFLVMLPLSRFAQLRSNRSNAA